MKQNTNCKKTMYKRFAHFFTVSKPIFFANTKNMFKYTQSVYEIEHNLKFCLI